MVWGKTSDRGEHRRRSQSPMGAYDKRGRSGREREAAVREGRGSRGGAPIWTAQEVWMPEPSLLILQAARDRFWAKVEKSSTCWRWTGSTDDKGYGRFWLNGQCEKAHRVAWMLKHGPVGEEIDVLHTCDSPACVNNEEHLWLGTHLDNMRDMYAKGRRDHSKISGEKNGSARLTIEEVEQIRRRLMAGESQRALGRAFGVNKRTIGRIRRGFSWRAVSDA